MRERLAECRVGIIGLGLMGGSLALALRDHCASIAGHDVDPGTVAAAIERGMIDDDLFAAPGAIDVVILAAPVGAILNWIPQLPDRLPGSFHLLDLGSSKARIVEAMRQLPDRVSPLGGHPMCGKETSGLDAAERDLFRDRVFVLTPLDRTRPETLRIGRQMVDAIGARMVMLDADRHDRIAAAISHLPYLTSVALVQAAARAGDEGVWALAASGFRDSTRLAASDVTMMLDILASNRRAVLDALARVQVTLDQLRDLIEGGDMEGLRAMLDENRSRRAGLFRSDSAQVS